MDDTKTTTDPNAVPGATAPTATGGGDAPAIPTDTTADTPVAPTTGEVPGTPAPAPTGDAGTPAVPVTTPTGDTTGTGGGTI